MIKNDIELFSDKLQTLKKNQYILKSYSNKGKNQINFNKTVAFKENNNMKYE
jgi:hypothetical protein